MYGMGEFLWLLILSELLMMGWVCFMSGKFEDEFIGWIEGFLYICFCELKVVGW